MLASLRAAVNSPTFVITPDTERASDGCPSTAESTNLGACEDEGTGRTPYQFLGYYLLQGAELPIPPRRELNCKRCGRVRTSRRAPGTTRVKWTPSAFSQARTAEPKTAKPWAHVALWSPSSNCARIPTWKCIPAEDNAGILPYPRWEKDPARPLESGFPGWAPTQHSAL